MTIDDKYRRFEPHPGEVWSFSSPDDAGTKDESTVYYFLEKMPPTQVSARFGSSHHTWKVVVLEGGTLEKIWPRCVTGAMIEVQFDGVSTGYGPPGHEHDEGWDSYDNCYTRLA